MNCILFSQGTDSLVNGASAVSPTNCSHGKKMLKLATQNQPRRKGQNRLVPESFERKLSGLAVRSVFQGMHSVGMMNAPEGYGNHDVRVERDIAYGSSGEEHHLLDVWRPDDDETYPAILYAHGGGFRILSKDTHWMMAKTLARQGYVVFNINYRLAPEHRYPAAAEDTCAAYLWMLDHADEFGADASRPVVAGESAGANLVCALTVAATMERAEPWAREVFNRGVVPAAAVPTCGMLQVSDPLRIERRKQISKFVRDRLVEAASAYLPNHDLEPISTPPMADPLRVLERAAQTDRPLPPMFAAVGTKDPLLDDTRRLAKTVERLGGYCDDRYYEGELHTFHALMWRENAQQYWRDVFDFLDDALDPATRPSPIRAAS
jgi:acetyl esterase